MLNQLFQFRFLMVLTLALTGSLALAQDAQITKGQAVYKTNCITCHGDKFDGMGDAGKYLSPRPRNLVTDKFKGGDKLEEILATVTTGLKGTAMPPFSTLPEDDRKAVAAYIFSLRKKK